MPNQIAAGQCSTEEDLDIEWSFASGYDPTGKALEVKVRDRASAAIKATLTVGAGLTIVGSAVKAKVAMATMSAWARTEYSADLVDKTGGAFKRLVPTRITFDEPGKLVGGVTGNSFQITQAGNRFVVTATRGETGPVGPATTLTIGTVTDVAPGNPPSASLTGPAGAQVLNLGLVRGTPGSGAPTSADILAIGEKGRLERALAAAGVPDEPSLILDFVRGVHFARNAAIAASVATLIAAIPGSSFTRSTVGYYFDVDRALKSAAVNVPRIDYDLTTGEPRFLKEPARTNFCRNNTFLGAATGSPGTLPSGITAVATAGLSREVVGVGVDSGIEYVDIRFSGTAGVGGSISVGLSLQADAAAAQNQIWAASCFVKLVGGSLAGAPQIELYISEFSASSGGFLGNGSAVVPTPTSAWSRPYYRRTLAFATTAYISENLYQYFPAGGAVDYTIRVGLPQLERDSVSSPIKTSGSTAARGADALSIGAGSWLTSAAGTLLVEGQAVGVQSISAMPLAQLDGGSRDVAPFLRAAASPAWGEEAYVKWGAGAAVQPRPNVAVDLTNRIRYAARYSGTALGVTRDNRAPTTGVANDAAGASALTRLIVGDGAFFGGGSVPILISRILFWPADLGNTKLRALSNQAAWS